MGKIITDNEELINLIEETPSLKQIVDKAEWDLSELDIRHIARALLDICDHVPLGVDEEMNLSYINMTLLNLKEKRLVLTDRKWVDEEVKRLPVVPYILKLCTRSVTEEELLEILETIEGIYQTVPTENRTLIEELPLLISKLKKFSKQNYQSGTSENNNNN